MQNFSHRASSLNAPHPHSDRLASTGSTATFNLIHFPLFSRADFILFRLFGPGLGNLLFPLYRAFQSQKTLGGRLVFPQFTQLKPGPFIRMEKDKRTYFDLFERRNLADVSLHIRARFSRPISENSFNPNGLNPGQAQIIKYEGLRGYFKDLEAQHRADFLEYLLDRASHVKDLRNDIAQISKNDICVHLRRGDFTAEAAEGADSGGMSYRIADDWYVAAVKKARERLPDARVRVFTDATGLERELLERLGCDVIDESQNALHALMKMSAHGAIVASKSSFSLWSAFLGQQRLYINKTFDVEHYLPSALLGHERV